MREGAPLRGGRKKGGAQSVGRSRGGRTSKAHALADARGRPVAFALTPGNVADIGAAPAPLGAVAPPRRLLTDRAYDADAFRAWLRARGTEAVVPSTRDRKRPQPLDRGAHRRRDFIERMVRRMKDRRRAATRYDRLAAGCISMPGPVAIACFWTL